MCLQAKEVIATIGQAFELAYRRYADAKKAREGFEQLKQVYHTASDSEKEKIRQQLEVERAKITKHMEEEQKREKQYMSELLYICILGCQNYDSYAALYLCLLIL